MYKINPKIEGHFSVRHIALVYTVIRQVFAAKCQVRCWASPCVIYGGQSNTWTGFPPST